MRRHLEKWIESLSRAMHSSATINKILVCASHILHVPYTSSCLVGCKRLTHSSFRHTTIMLDMCTENQCIALEKTEGAIKNRQSRDAGNIGYTIVTQNDDKQSKKHKTESYKNGQYRPTKKGNEPMCSRRIMILTLTYTYLFVFIFLNAHNAKPH